MERDVSDFIPSEVMEELNEGEAKSAARTVSGEDYRRRGDGRVK